MNQIYCVIVGEKSESLCRVFVFEMAFDKSAQKDLFIKLFNVHVILKCDTYLHLAKSTRT